MELLIESFRTLIAACNCVFCAAILVHDFYIGQPKGRQILDNDVALFIESKLTLGGIIGTRLDLGIRVGIGEIVFGNFLVILSVCKLFLKYKLVNFIGGKFEDFFLFAFFIHGVEPPFLSFASIRFFQNIIGIAKRTNAVNGQDERLRRH